MSTLRQHPGGRRKTFEDQLIDTDLACGGCGAVYPVRSGVAHFTDKDEVRETYPVPSNGRAGPARRETL